MGVKISGPVRMELPVKHKSINCADITSYNGMFYLAYRTSPSHFPSKSSKIIICSSKDTENWEMERMIYMRSNLKDPHFLPAENSLLLYFFNGAHGKLAKLKYVELREDKWSAVKQTGIENTCWRIRKNDNRYYMSVYNGKNMYRNHQPKLKLLNSKDGRKWTQYLDIPINIKGAAEPEFIFDRDKIFGTIRLEGSGSVIFRYDGKFKFKRLRSKYDSCRMFMHNDKLYMVSRKNREGISHRYSRRTYNTLRYALTRKTTALFEFDRELKIKHIKDIESHGDTGFPAMVGITPDSYLLINYSSVIKKKNYPWIYGQLKKTELYKYILRL